MSILKALQKKQFEQSNTGAETPKGTTLVPFDRIEQSRRNRAKTRPEMVALENFKI